MKRKIISFILVGCLMSPGLIARASSLPEPKMIVSEENLIEETIQDSPKLEEVLLETPAEIVSDSVTEETVVEEPVEVEKVDIIPAAEESVEETLVPEENVLEESEEEIPAEEIAETKIIGTKTIYTKDEAGVITKTVKSFGEDDMTEESLEYGYIDENGDFYLYVEKVKQEKTININISYTKESVDGNLVATELSMPLIIPESGVVNKITSEDHDVKTILEHINMPETLTTGFNIVASFDINGNITSIEGTPTDPEITETKVREGELTEMDFELDKEYIDGEVREIKPEEKEESKDDESNDIEAKVKKTESDLTEGMESAEVAIEDELTPTGIDEEALAEANELKLSEEPKEEVLKTDETSVDEVKEEESTEITVVEEPAVDETTSEETVKEDELAETVSNEVNSDTTEEK